MTGSSWHDSRLKYIFSTNLCSQERRDDGWWEWWWWKRWTNACESERDWLVQGWQSDEVDSRDRWCIWQWAVCDFQRTPDCTASKGDYINCEYCEEVEDRYRMTMTLFAITLYGQGSRRNVVGQRVVSDISVARGCWSICCLCSESNNISLLLRLRIVLGTSALLHTPNATWPTTWQRVLGDHNKIIVLHCVSKTTLM